MPETRTRRGLTRLSHRGRAFAATGLVLAVTAGVLWWRADRQQAPAPVAVPQRVCDGSVSADSLGKLLPERGNPYQEYLSEGPAQTHVSTWCTVHGGGATVTFFYVREMIPDGFEQQLAKRLKRQENAPLTWGPVKGWGNDTGAHLYVDCPDEELGLVQQVHVEVGYSKPLEHRVDDVRAVLGQLVADGARYVAKGLKCKGADNLPTGPATFG
ncbi:hypothetical protein ACFTWD_08400 [Streptomyces sp. NPDC056943]|uniref:hypothetical protein n=1 Tax=Streptomyces sp. NPDC056943 TaxID=3345971 RepID=UPI00363E9BBD